MDKLTQKYSNRINLQPLFCMMLGFTFLGCVGHYVNHKIKVIEPAWVEEYGRDYPVKVMLAPKRFYYYQKWVNLLGRRYEYKYYADE